MFCTKPDPLAHNFCLLFVFVINVTNTVNVLRFSVSLCVLVAAIVLALLCKSNFLYVSNTLSNSYFKTVIKLLEPIVTVY